VLISTLVCATALGAQPRAGSLPPQVEVPHDFEIEMGRELHLTLGSDDPRAILDCSESIANAIAPATSTTTSTSPASLESIVVFWSDPLVDEKMIPFVNGSALVEIPRGPGRTARFHLVWRPPGERIQMTVPAPPRRFMARIVPERPAAVIEATGTFEGVVFGDVVPVHIRVRDPVGLDRVIIHHRSAPAGPFTTAAMMREGEGAGDELWRISLPRPAGLEAMVEYYIELRDRAGRTTQYGNPTTVHRIRLEDPTKTR
jgi:hypothetical protein